MIFFMWVMIFGVTCRTTSEQEKAPGFVNPVFPHSMFFLWIMGWLQIHSPTLSSDKIMFGRELHPLSSLVWLGLSAMVCMGGIP